MSPIQMLLFFVFLQIELAWVRCVYFCPTGLQAKNKLHLPTSSAVQGPLLWNNETRPFLEKVESRQWPQRMSITISQKVSLITL